MGQTCKSNNSNERKWKLAQQATSNCNKNFAKEIKKVQKEKKGITDQQINNWLSCVPNFIGCFAENDLKNLTITSFPSFLIVNIDSNDLPGSHWMALGIFKESIEIFDPLGFDIFNWTQIPCNLLEFLHNMSVTRRVYTASKIQSGGFLCGFYSIFYVIVRKYLEFDCIEKFFCAKFLNRNDSLLYNFFKYAN